MTGTMSAVSKRNTGVVRMRASEVTRPRASVNFTGVAAQIYLDEPLSPTAPAMRGGAAVRTLVIVSRVPHASNAFTAARWSHTWRILGAAFAKVSALAVLSRGSTLSRSIRGSRNAFVSMLRRFAHLKRIVMDPYFSALGGALYEKQGLDFLRMSLRVADTARMGERKETVGAERTHISHPYFFASRDKKINASSWTQSTFGPYSYGTVGCECSFCPI